MEAVINVGLRRNSLIPVALLIIFICTGCSSKRKGEWEEVPPAKPLQVEILNPLDQAAEEISKTPTKFALQFPDAQVSWDRARLFFDRYTTNSAFVAAGRGTVRINNRASSKDATIYEVERRDIPAGIEFTLRCSSRGTTHGDPEQRCRNLARFMREGMWEAGL